MHSDGAPLRWEEIGTAVDVVDLAGLDHLLFALDMSGAPVRPSFRPSVRPSVREADLLSVRLSVRSARPSHYYLRLGVLPSVR